MIALGIAPALVPPIVALSPPAAPVTRLPPLSLTVIVTVVAVPTVPAGTLAVDCAGLRTPVNATATEPVLVVVVPFAEAVAI